jgi:hypothetical protein
MRFLVIDSLVGYLQEWCCCWFMLEIRENMGQCKSEGQDCKRD